MKILNVIQHGIIRLNQQFAIIAIDSEIELLFNKFFYKRNDEPLNSINKLTGMQWQNIVSDLQGSSPENPWLVACQTKVDQTVKLTLNNKDALLSLSLRYSPVFDHNDSVLEVLVFIVISDTIQQIEKDLQIEKAFYRAMVKDMPALIYRYTTDGIVTLANAELCSYFGADADDIIGMSIYDVMDAENVEGAKIHLAGITPENPICSHEHSGKDYAGNVRWYQWTDRLILSNDGQPLGYQGIGLDLTERKIHEEELLRLATTDTLTGLLNRRQCFTLAEQELARCRQHNRPFSLLITDIDFFKHVNDRFGHMAGDKALQSFATLCTKALRDIDIIGRFGGEEFIIILPETDLQGAIISAERLRQNVEAMNISFNENNLKITVSIGIATNDEHPEMSLDSMLVKADEALYNAKTTGRNKVVTWPIKPPA
ncbi:sensor domain-containing diguanylate cyclase [Shewanella litoralis]|nr:sensor domain-containing diguanylate cyclase [Shewanella litoralis]